MNAPSIFNDVLGPVMRGPSSSHCAAALRIGRLARNLMDDHIENVEITFDPNGSLATTHAGQGSDMGLFGGFLGWEANDHRLPEYKKFVHQTGLNFNIKIEDIQARHPNTYQLELNRFDETHTMTALSVGGGMIEVIEIDGITVSIDGGYYETLIYSNDPASVTRYLNEITDVDEVRICEGPRQQFVEVKSQTFLGADIRDEILSLDCVQTIKQLSPVLPIRSRKDLKVPFLTCSEMLAFNESRNWPLWKLGLHYEAQRGNLSEGEVIEKMDSLVKVMQSAVDTGLRGTSYDDRILGAQSTVFQKKMLHQSLISSDVLNRIILFVSAIMEVKSSMGVIVAAPTAGACGALPGACLGAASSMGSSDAEVTKAMLAAGMIGVFIAAHATFAAEVGGCQAECGAGAGMAAAALTTLAGGTIDQALAASSLALQNSFGMICDPVANRVEAPCLGKNVMAASNALSCTNMALSDYDPLIPLDEVITAMAKVGHSIPFELRCTGLGGLSATPTARAIEARLTDSDNEEFVGLDVLRFKSC